MIYTSYFSSKKYNKEDGVSIARYTKFWNGPVYEKLYPSKTLLSWWKHKRENGQHKDPIYTRQYIQAYYEETLSKLDPYEVAKELDGKVLLCYEKPNELCHRHLVTNWLLSNGIKCKEIE